MKNLQLHLSIVILLFGMQSFAQNEKISIGIKLFPGLSKSVGSIDTKFKFSMGEGVQFVSNFGKFIGIETGVQFRSYGFTIEEPLTDENGYIIGQFDIRNNFNYISLPILIRVNIHSFYMSLGSNINFFISGKSNFQGQYVQGVQSTRIDIENANIIVIEPNVNLGYQFAINNKFGINLESRFSYTVNGILESDNEIQFLNIGVGVGFCYFIVPRE